MLRHCFWIDQAFDNASAFASVYQVGKLEAGACTNLLKHMDQSTRDALRDLVRLGATAFHNQFQ